MNYEFYDQKKKFNQANMVLACFDWTFFTVIDHHDPKITIKQWLFTLRKVRTVTTCSQKRNILKVGMSVCSTSPTSHDITFGAHCTLKVLVDFCLVLSLEFCLLKLLIFYKKLLWNIRSGLNSSTFWVFEPVLKYVWSKSSFLCTKLQFWPNISKYMPKTQNVE